MPAAVAIPIGVHVIGHPIVQVKLTQLRDAQTGSEDFRARVTELAMLMVFEATRDLAAALSRVGSNRVWLLGRTKAARPRA